MENPCLYQSILTFFHFLFLLLNFSIVSSTLRHAMSKCYLNNFLFLIKSSFLFKSLSISIYFKFSAHFPLTAPTFLFYQLAFITRAYLSAHSYTHTQACRAAHTCHYLSNLSFRAAKDLPVYTLIKPS